VTVKRIVIVGGGFAGLWGAMAAVRQLEDAGRAGDVELTLVSRDPGLTVRPRLHEAHPGEHMRVALAGVLGPIGVELVRATATGIDVDRRLVRVVDAAGETRSPRPRRMGALYTRGWDRAPVKVRAEAKAMKRQINTVWIYPPTGDRRDILAAAVPGQHRKASA
jgi:hypothetical protein